ncbi:Hvo_1808 family surface protein [Halocalculus aciditolerans]|nr:Hvo_1808 family surface protein [Halocalculus aciditolerans]
MRTRSVLAVAALLVFAGCVGTPVTQPLAGSADAPPDPATDQLGWEAGYWYNESLAITTDDGLNESEFQAVVNRAMARDEHIRNIEFEKQVPVEVMTREEYRQQSNGGGSPSEARLAFDNAKFQSLFLVGQDENSLSVQQSNQGSSVLGFYSPSKDEIVIVTNGENAVIDELTLAHELDHALQFRNFEMGYASPTRDASNAHSGLIEGDARYVENRYEEYCGEAWQCVKPEPKSGSSSGSGGSSLNLGVYIVKYFPYSDGPGFVGALKDAGGWDAVNDAYSDPPDTAKEVALPETYPEAGHTNVSLADTSDGEWDRVTVPGRAPYGEVGVAGITAMVAYPSYDDSKEGGVVKPRTFLNYKPNGDVQSDDPFNYTNRYADGWTGDKLYVYQNAADETAYVWRVTWESPGDAQTFASGYRNVLAYWGGETVNDANTRYRIADGGFRGAYFLQTSGTTTTIVYAPRASDLDDVRQGTPT